MLFLPFDFFLPDNNILQRCILVKTCFSFSVAFCRNSWKSLMSHYAGPLRAKNCQTLGSWQKLHTL